MLRLARLTAALTSVLAVSLAAPSTGAADRSLRLDLVRAYSPIVMLRAQEDPPCDSSEEQYLPTKVEAVLGNPKVRLIPPAGSSEEVEVAPTASDIAGLGDGWYLDLPGDPLDAGCTYAKDFAELVDGGDAPAVAYAHIRKQPGESGLVLQYWLYYYFNDFNDLHESDWEGLQIVFDGPHVVEALAQGPSEIGLFQHGGGERADWEDDKVEKDGTHPVVYAGAGSHATFYESAVYIENGQQGSGVGCDDASEPLRRVAPRPLLVPTDPPPGSRFEWLRYTGRWGQKEAGFNNGPTGPNTKLQWLRPFETQSDMRSTSAKLPDGSLLGPSVTGAFCGAVAEVTGFINLKARSATGALLLAGAALLLLCAPLVVTRWRPVSLSPLRRQRRFGQLVRAARQLYGRHWSTLLVIGLCSFPIVAALDGLRWAIEALVGDLWPAIGSVHVSLGTEGAIVPVAAAIGSAVVSGAVVTFARELDRGRTVGFTEAFRLLAPRFWAVAFAQLLATLTVILIALTVIGIPFAIWKYVQWQFVQQEILFEGRRVRDAFRGSAAVVRGRWWSTVWVAAFLWLLTDVSVPLLGFALIFADVPLLWINLLGSLLFAALIPYVTLTRTLLYLDLASRPQEQPAAAGERRRWLPRGQPRLGAAWRKAAIASGRYLRMLA